MQNLYQPAVMEFVPAPPPTMTKELFAKMSVEEKKKWAQKRRASLDKKLAEHAEKLEAFKATQQSVWINGWVVPLQLADSKDFQAFHKQEVLAHLHLGALEIVIQKPKDVFSTLGFRCNSALDIKAVPDSIFSDFDTNVDGSIRSVTHAQFFDGSKRSNIVAIGRGLPTYLAKMLSSGDQAKVRACTSSIPVDGDGQAKFKCPKCEKETRILGDILYKQGGKKAQKKACCMECGKKLNGDQVFFLIQRL